MIRPATATTDGIVTIATGMSAAAAATASTAMTTGADMVATAPADTTDMIVKMTMIAIGAGGDGAHSETTLRP